jgi:predicted MFS family arabinose efflux permease
VRVLFGRLADGMGGGRLLLVGGMLGAGVAGFVMLATGSPALVVPGVLLAFAAGWGWPGLFNFAVVRSNPGAPAAATGVTQTGASGGAAVGPVLFGVVVEAAGYGTAWLVCGALALVALVAILAGRRTVLRGRASRAAPLTNAPQNG